jgi:hypothetical protein
MVALAVGAAVHWASATILPLPQPGIYFPKMFVHSGPVSLKCVPVPQPEIYFPKGYDTNRANRVNSVLRSDKFKYLRGLVGYGGPQSCTSLVYDGNGEDLTAFLTALNGVEGISVRLTFSADLSKETGNALRAGSWWVKHSHTMPDTITVRINLAAEALGRDKFELRLPKAIP